MNNNDNIFEPATCTSYLIMASLHAATETKDSSPVMHHIVTLCIIITMVRKHVLIAVEPLAIFPACIIITQVSFTFSGSYTLPI
jgi:hypothetical protein